MSLDLDKINGLLKIVKEAAGHPTKLKSLGALAMRELEAHDAEAKKEHDELLKKDAAEAAKAKADADAKAKKLAEADAKSTELTSRPQPTAQQMQAERDAATAKQKALDEAEAKRLVDQAEKDKEAASAGVQADGPNTVRRKVPEEAL